MNMIKQRLLTNWHFMRFVRLIISILILIMAVPAHDWLMASFGVFFLYTALAGVGCCGTARCYVRRDKKSLTDIDYEEIK